MPENISRRVAVKQLTVSGAVVMFAGVLRGGSVGNAAAITIAGKPVEIAVWSVSAATIRITVRPIDGTGAVPVPVTGALVREEMGTRRVRTRDSAGASRVRIGDLMVSYSEAPPTISIRTNAEQEIQRLTLDATNPGMSFLLGDGPLLGFGEGGHNMTVAESPTTCVVDRALAAAHRDHFCSTHMARARPFSG